MPSGGFGWLGEGLVPWGFGVVWLFDSGVWLFGVFGSVCSLFVSLAHFLACFVFVAGFAECLEVVEGVCSAACGVEDVVDFEVLCASAFDAFVSVALEGLFAEFFGCSSGWVLPHVCLLCALLQS